MRKIATLFLCLFHANMAFSQTYTQMQWGINRGVTPYTFGANINGTWRDFGTVSPLGVWTIPTSSLSGTIPTSSLSGNLVITSFNGGASASSATFWRGDGAWASPSAAATGSVDPVAYGADTSGAVSSSTALTNSIAALPNLGGAITFQCGVYLLSNFTVNKSVRFVGPTVANDANNTSCVTLKASSTTGNFITVAANNVSFEGISFDSTANRTTGAYIISTTTVGTTVKSVRMTKHYQGIRLSGGNVTVDGLRCYDGTPNSTAADSGCAFFGLDGYTYGSAENIYAFSTSSLSSNWPTYGIRLNYVDVFHLYNFLVIRHNRTLSVLPISGQTASNFTLTNGTVDSSSDGVFVGGAGGNIVRGNISHINGMVLAPGIAGTDGRGIVIDGTNGTISDITIEYNFWNGNKYGVVTNGAVSRAVVMGNVANNNSTSNAVLSWTCTSCVNINNIGF